MDKLRFQLTAQWVAELLQDPKFDKVKFGQYVKNLMNKPKVEYSYPIEVEHQQEDLIKGIF